VGGDQTHAAEYQPYFVFHFQLPRLHGRLVQ
jgi:hypothetical protein